MRTETQGSEYAAKGATAMRLWFERALESYWYCHTEEPVRLGSNLEGGYWLPRDGKRWSAEPLSFTISGILEEEFGDIGKGLVEIEVGSRGRRLPRGILPRVCPTWQRRLRGKRWREVCFWVPA